MLPPLLVPHYDAWSAILHKIEALSGRSEIQARDIFDLYILSSQCEIPGPRDSSLSLSKLSRAYKSAFEISFEQFRDTVISYLHPAEQHVYNSPPLWDEVRLKAANFIDEIRGLYA